jgi:hypothetical protein
VASRTPHLARVSRCDVEMRPQVLL